MDAGLLPARRGGQGQRLGLVSALHSGRRASRSTAVSDQPELSAILRLSLPGDCLPGVKLNGTTLGLALGCGCDQHSVIGSSLDLGNSLGGRR